MRKESARFAAAVKAPWATLHERLPRNMTTRLRNLVILGAVLALAATGVFFFAPSTRQRSAIEAIPDGAFMLVTVDLAALRSSPLAREVTSLREVSDIVQECGFDPIARAKSVAIGVPEKPDGVFGIAITTDIPESDLLRCAESVMAARSATPRITTRGSWTELEQEGVSTDTARAKIAQRAGAPLLVARGDYLATMQATLDGKAAPRNTAHDALRKVALDHEGGAFFVLTAILPKSVRDRLKDEGPADEHAATMTAILSVSAASMAVTARGDSLDVFAELRCESDAACSTVRDFIDRKRTEIASKPAARFVGIGAVLEALRLETHGSVLDLSLSAPESDIARAARALWSAAFAPSSPPPRAGDGSAGGGTVAEPGETVGGRDGGPGFSGGR
jgi:hypothetical protein